jgi:hypothetical protein
MTLDGEEEIMRKSKCYCMDKSNDKFPGLCSVCYNSHHDEGWKERRFWQNVEVQLHRMTEGEDKDDTK